MNKRRNAGLPAWGQMLFLACLLLLLPACVQEQQAQEPAGTPTATQATEAATEELTPTEQPAGVSDLATGNEGASVTAAQDDPAAGDNTVVITLMNTSNDMLTPTQTGSAFCRAFYVQATGGGTAAEVSFTATELSGTNAATAQPRLSTVDCTDAEENPDAGNILYLENIGPHEIREVWYFARLNQVAAYTGLIVLQVTDEAPRSYTLTIERTAQNLTDGLAISSPAPVQGTLNIPIIGTLGSPGAGESAPGNKIRNLPVIGAFLQFAEAHVTMPFIVDSTDGGQVPLAVPELRALDEIEGGNVVANVQGGAYVSLIPDTPTTIQPGSGQGITLTVSGLPAGEYQAQVAAPTEDGRRITGTGTIYVKHFFLWPLLFITFAVLVIEAVRYYNSTGRDKDIARYQLTYILPQIAQLQENATELVGYEDNVVFVAGIGALKRWYNTAYELAEIQLGSTPFDNLQQDSKARLQQTIIALDHIESAGKSLQMALEKVENNQQRSEINHLQNELQEAGENFFQVLSTQNLGQKDVNNIDVQLIIDKMQPHQNKLATLSARAGRLINTWLINSLRNAVSRLPDSTKRQAILDQVTAAETHLTNNEITAAETNLFQAHREYLILYQSTLRKGVQTLTDSGQKDDLGRKLDAAIRFIADENFKAAETLLDEIYREYLQQYQLELAVALQNLTDLTARRALANALDVVRNDIAVGNLPAAERKLLEIYKQYLTGYLAQVRKSLTGNAKYEALLADWEKAEEAFNANQFSVANEYLQAVQTQYLQIYLADLRQAIESLEDKDAKSTLGNDLAAAETALRENRMGDAHQLAQQVYAGYVHAYLEEENIEKQLRAVEKLLAPHQGNEETTHIKARLEDIRHALAEAENEIARYVVWQAREPEFWVLRLKTMFIVLTAEQKEESAKIVAEALTIVDDPGRLRNDRFEKYEEAIAAFNNAGLEQESPFEVAGAKRIPFPREVASRPAAQQPALGGGGLVGFLQALGSLAGWIPLARQDSGQGIKMEADFQKNAAYYEEQGANRRTALKRRLKITRVATGILSLIIAMIVGYATQVINQPDFGSWEDYMALLLFVLGGTALTSTEVAGIAFSSFRSYLGGT